MTLEEQLLRDEGFRSKVYSDTLGKYTVGVGRNLTDKGITKNEALYLLSNDIFEVKKSLAVYGYIGDVDDPRYNVLLNIAFNIGTAGLLSWRNTLALYKNGDYKACAAEIRNNKRWSSQVHDRAERLAKQMETGIWV